MSISATLTAATSETTLLDFDDCVIDLIQQPFGNAGFVNFTPALIQLGLPDTNLTASVDGGPNGSNITVSFGGDFPLGLNLSDLLDLNIVNTWLAAASDVQLTTVEIIDDTQDFVMNIDFGDAGPTLLEFVEDWNEDTLRENIAVLNNLPNPSFKLDDDSNDSEGVERTGNNSDDRLEGTDRDDKLAGRGGDDDLFGRKGDDLLCGGGGEDSLIGGNGQDELMGGNGDDFLGGGRAADVIMGGAGKDVLRGGEKTDFISGGKGNDFIKGGKGDDTIILSAGKDKVQGNGGADTFIFKSGQTGGRDTLHVDDSDTIELRNYADGTDFAVTKLKKDVFELVVGDDLSVAEIKFDGGRGELVDMIDFI